MPVEVVLGQRRHHHDLRRPADVGGLEARRLHDPAVDVGRRLGVERRIARCCRPRSSRVPSAVGQRAGDRRRRALALGAGDAGDPRAVRLLQPQARGRRPGAAPPRATAIAASPYRLMPGLFTTTAQSPSAASAAGGSTSPARPPPARRGRSSTTTPAPPRARRGGAGWPGPRCPRPRRRRRRSGGQPTRRAVGIRVRDEGAAHRLGQGGGGHPSADHAGAQLAAQRAEHRAVAAVGSVAGQHRGGAALARRRRRTRTASRRRRGRAGSGTPAAGRAGRAARRRRTPSRSAARRQERGEDQVDEAALVALAAPVVEALRRVEVEGPVAAAERAVVPLEARRTARRSTARSRAAAARSTRVRRRGPRPARPGTRPRTPGSSTTGG